MEKRGTAKALGQVLDRESGDNNMIVIDSNPAVLLQESTDAESFVSCHELEDALEGLTGVVEQVSLVRGAEDITEVVASQGKYTAFKVLRS